MTKFHPSLTEQQLNRIQDACILLRLAIKQGYIYDPRISAELFHDLAAQVVDEIVQAELDKQHELALIEDAIRRRFPERFCAECGRHMNYIETFWGSREWACYHCDIDTE